MIKGLKNDNKKKYEKIQMLLTKKMANNEKLKEIFKLAEKLSKESIRKTICGERNLEEEKSLRTIIKYIKTYFGVKELKQLNERILNGGWLGRNTPHF